MKSARFELKNRIFLARTRFSTLSRKFAIAARLISIPNFSSQMSPETFELEWKENWKISLIFLDSLLPSSDAFGAGKSRFKKRYKLYEIENL